MRLLGSHRRGQALGIALVMVTLASCGGSSTSGSGSGSPSAVTCSQDASVLGVSEGRLCVDSGFRLDSNDFSFPNWSGIEGSTDELNTATMIRLFGATTVCSSGGTAEDCVLNPAVQSTVDQWSDALDGGRCEGMATLAMRYFLGIQDPSEAESGTTKAASLNRPKLTVDQEINTWWATQFMPEVRAAAAKSRKLEPAALVSELIDGLKSKTGYTIGIYGNGYGHSVTPFAVTKNGSIFSIHIYDNNYPGKPAVIEVDESSNTWKYDEAAVNPDGGGSTWSGGKGTIELTPMNVRSGPFSDEFGAVSDGVKGSAILSMAVKSSKGQPAAGLLITTASGKHVGVFNAQLVNEINGATYTVGKGGRGTSLVTVELLDSSEAFSVQVVGATAAVDSNQRSVTLSVATPDGSRTQISSERALDSKPATSIDGAEISVDLQRGVTFSPSVESEVTITNNKDKVVVRVPQNGSLIATKSNQGSSVTSKDASGKEIEKKILKKAAVRRSVATGPVATTHSTALARTSTTTVRRTSTTTTTLVRRSTTTTTVKKPPTTTTTVKKPQTTSTSTTVDGSTTTTVPRSTTTVPRTTTTVRRTTTTTTAVP